jgi:hypothetical protein
MKAILTLMGSMRARREDPPAAPTRALNYVQKRAIVNIVPSIPRRTIPVDKGTWVAAGGLMAADPTDYASDGRHLHS